MLLRYVELLKVGDRADMTPEQCAANFASRCGQPMSGGYRRVHEDDLARAFMAHREAVFAEMRNLPFGLFALGLSLHFPAADDPNFAARIEAWRDAAHSTIDLTASSAKPAPITEPPAEPAATE